MIICCASPAGYSVTSRLVCPFGQFEFLCRLIDATTFAWTINFPDLEGLGVDDPGTQVISAMNAQPDFEVVIKNYTVLSISTSSLSPSTSSLEINNTTAALNGTTITCFGNSIGAESIVIIIGSGKTNATSLKLSDHLLIISRHPHSRS